MAQHSRDTLKRYFRHGAMPAQDAFTALIESMLNIVDQQFDKTPTDGLKVGQIGQGRLLSFYHDIDQKSAIWSVRMETPGRGLVFGTGGLQERGDTDNAEDAYRRAMELSPAPGGARFATLADSAEPDASRFQLDLQGRVLADGRIGRAVASVLANGQWQPITGNLTGCHAFEVMAGTGKKGSGKYALMHAYAVNAFQGGKGDITYHQAHCGSKCSRLELRWTRESPVAGDPYRLEIRTGCALDSAGTPDERRTRIRVHLTQLWFDPAMDECRPLAEGGLP
ncbi:hypothetical protein GQ37_013975 [Janthinobacterium sp. BJB1]|uniref:hypothetical protein n=1 Tax=Janthinobacterium sp. GW458P TaxID=1981504 RepID=UPI000A3257D1|nr:hypothetical protein [Janthinobacterium sp. GW458P]MBE3024382.1 hypothetical protein [Janthinobacterium sp. GW458P]PHV15158.1 hypothetical protein CSQ90_19220 [Janthinobacterium sp. BJB303]PJC98163.1 hypothetical protein GQ37_013975 [Janthinobacterium sp. BJB1]